MTITDPSAPYPISAPYAGAVANPPDGVSSAEATLSRLTNESPDTWPEVLREMTAVAGAADGLIRLTRELRERLGHVLVPGIPADPSGPMPAPYPTDSVVGQRLRATYGELVDGAHVLEDILRRLAV